MQRYEGASTIYGQHTLQAYIQQYQKLATALCTNEPVPQGPVPKSLLDKEISLQPGVIFDTRYFGKKFGDVLQDVKPQYAPGDIVAVTFVSGHPRNNLMVRALFLLCLSITTYIHGICKSLQQ